MCVVLFYLVSRVHICVRDEADLGRKYDRYFFKLALYNYFFETVRLYLGQPKIPTEIGHFLIQRKSSSTTEAVNYFVTFMEKFLSQVRIIVSIVLH